MLLLEPKEIIRTRGKPMATEIKGMATRNKGALLFGITLFVIGLVATFYQVVVNQYTYGVWVGYAVTFPYQNIGIILVLAGIIFVGLGFFYSPRKAN